jgi:coiled-coil domain-containing protein 115
MDERMGIDEAVVAENRSQAFPKMCMSVSQPRQLSMMPASHAPSLFVDWIVQIHALMPCSSQNELSPAPSPNSSSPADAPTTPDPVARLDALLEIYLGRLDTYQRLREQLSQNFSAAFLSLAHANRTSNLGSGRHYGEERYDERMKAGRRVEILGKSEEETDEPRPKEVGRYPGTELKSGKMFLAIKQYRPPSPESEDVAKSSVPAETKLQTPDSGVVDTASTSPQSKFASWATHSSAIPTASTEARPASASPFSANHPDFEPSKPKSKKSLNPLNWYGVLIPQSLRGAQTSFTRALEDQIAQLVNVQAEMAGLEAQIRQLRKADRFLQVNSHGAGGTTDEAPMINPEGQEILPSQPDGPQTDPPAEEKHEMCLGKSRGSGKKSLSSRSREAPRSRVLKVDT